MSGYQWFDIGSCEDPEELAGDALTFATVLRERTASWASEDVDDLLLPDADGSLIAALSLADPVSHHHLIHFGVHLGEGRVRGDRLHSQLFSLPDHPSGWALTASGDPRELGAQTADWFRTVLRKPVVLYVWLHHGYAYAARYAFADTGETLIQNYQRGRAPHGQADELIEAGHVHGRGWIQTTGLSRPDLYLHIHGDLEPGLIPPSIPAETRRGPIAGIWYE
ncbi:hypothetical protein ORV05_15300 [Amycolatopsis cynarae]|uniref:Uncharacterized protein n=1 Tax=Amycolatopsis cynarae TaxID=2995223 RepID=A0ABY7BAR6_9PSEU|nr:hypothetical protein [Amycolatopsis sp. HUAS 11-8]WAL69072.1 hypothetical protein ORV05_15300 [Amycolatopsis sp. HUAS 11-8]